MLPILTLCLLLCGPAMAQEVIVEYSDNSLPVLNESLRNTQSRLNYVENNIIPAERGGTGLNLSGGNSGVLLQTTGSGIGTLPQGTSGQYLQSNGVNSSPSFTTITSTLQLVSTTTVTNAKTTGNIAISPTENYMVVFNLTLGTGSSGTTGDLTLLFNADSGAHYDQQNNLGAVAVNQSSVLLVSGADDENSKSGLPIAGDLYIYPQGSFALKQVFIKGDCLATDISGNKLLSNMFSDYWRNSDTLTSFVINWSGNNNLNGNVYLYKLNH
jgi:hypothetical protein